MSIFQANGKSYDSRGRWRTQTYTHADAAGGIDRTLYIVGDEFTDGSVRFSTRNTGNQIRGKIESRANQVWNTGQMEMGETSLFLGTNLSLQALGTSLEIDSIDGTARAIQLDIPISDDEGTSQPRVLRAQPRVDRVVAQPLFGTDTVSNLFLVPVVTGFQGFVLNLYLKVGEIAPVDEVTIQVTTGLVPGGDLIYEQFYGANVFIPNTEIQLMNSIDLGTFVGDEVMLSISTDTAFSLLTNIVGRIWFAVDIQAYQYEELISATTGTNKFLVSRTSGNLMSDSSGNVMLNDRALAINGIFI